MIGHCDQSKEDRRRSLLPLVPLAENPFFWPFISVSRQGLWQGSPFHDQLTSSFHYLSLTLTALSLSLSSTLTFSLSTSRSLSLQTSTTSCDHLAPAVTLPHVPYDELQMGGKLAPQPSRCSQQWR